MNRETLKAIAAFGAGIAIAEALYRYGYNVGTRDEKLRQAVLRAARDVWGTPDSLPLCAICGNRHPGAVPKMT